MKYTKIKFLHELPVPIGAKWKSDEDGLEQYSVCLLDDTDKSTWCMEVEFYAKNIDAAYKAIKCLLSDVSLNEELEMHHLQQIGGVLRKTFHSGIEYQVATFIYDKRAISWNEYLLAVIRKIREVIAG